MPAGGSPAMSHSSPLQATQRLWTLALVLAWLSRGRRTLGLGRCRRRGRDFDCLTHFSGYLERIRPPPRSCSTAMISGIAISSFMPTTSTPGLGTLSHFVSTSPLRRRRHKSRRYMRRCQRGTEIRLGEGWNGFDRGPCAHSLLRLSFSEIRYRTHCLGHRDTGAQRFHSCTNRGIDPFVLSHLEIISAKDLRLCLFVSILA